jgi:hypothetical protein
MSFFKIHKDNFYNNLFEYNKVPSLYNEILEGRYANTCISKNKYTLYNIPLTVKINSFELVPDYLILNAGNGFVLKKVFQKYGYAANLTQFESIEDYIKINFKSSFRNNVKRSIKRLESSFNINYKMFYGAISFEEYTTLMTSFHAMLSKRFKQRNVKNITLDNWEHYLKISFDCINNKDASLFVIFQEHEPIAYSLNFHFDTAFYFAIPTFNLDFSKFTLGNVVIYKNMEWALNNGFSLFDMGYGGFENKINWCNKTYLFENHVLYKPENRIGSLYAVLLKYKYKLINYLIAKNVNGLKRNLINYVKGRKPYTPLTYKVVAVDKSFTFNEHNTLQIDYKTTTYAFLKKPIYDFLYKNCENIKNITVYKFNNEQNTFLISGINKKLIIKALLNEIN